MGTTYGGATDTTEHSANSPKFSKFSKLHPHWQPQVMAGLYGKNTTSEMQYNSGTSETGIYVDDSMDHTRRSSNVEESDVEWFADPDANNRYIPRELIGSQRWSPQKLRAFFNMPSEEKMFEERQKKKQTCT